ncbi:MAG TPA: PASTA domain-containing protein [Firmicutes bacterium]|nr:PASTA domain-containing protein [Bacillota bacterium]
MNGKWHVLHGGQECGPYSEEELIYYIKEGNIDAQDLLWNEVIDQWTPVDKFPRFSETLASASQTLSHLPDSVAGPQKKKKTGIFLGLAGGLLVVIVAAVILLPYLTGSGSPPSGEGRFGSWSYRQTITEPLTAIIGDHDVTIGDLSSHGVTIRIPGDFLDDETQVILTHPEETYDLSGASFVPLGVPVDIKLDGKTRRFDEPVKIALQFDSTNVTEEGEILAAYFHPTQGWDYYYPDKVDLERGIAEFSVYHFSSYSVVQVDDDERIDKYLERKSVEQYVQQMTADEAEAHVEAMVEAILKEGLAVKDNQTISIITKAVIKEIPGGKLGLAAYDLKGDDFISLIAEGTVKKAGSVLTDNIDGFGWEEGLFTDAAANPGQVKSLSEAAGHFYEGNEEEALKILTKAIADEIPVIKTIKKVGEVAVEVVGHNIEVWKHQEVEKAYRSYRDGANGGWWGRNFDAGDWDQLVAQSGGELRQVRIDYIKSWCENRGLDPNSLSNEQRLKLGDQALEHLKEQFDTRREREAEIAEIKAKNMEVIEILRDKKMLERSIYDNPMYTGSDGEDLEMLLNRLFITIDRIKQETGRTEIVSEAEFWAADPHERGNMIAKEWVADLAHSYYANRDRYNDNIEKIKTVDSKEPDSVEIEEAQIEEQIEEVLVAVPGLTGQDRAGAEYSLDNLGLKAEVTIQKHDTIEEGRVISQQPAAGAMVQAGSSVKINVSGGPLQATVPNVIGQEGNAAVQILDQSGFKYQAVADYHDSVAAGFVIDQHPKAETILEPGSVVKILVSRGPESQETVQTPQQPAQPVQPTQPPASPGIAISDTFKSDLGYSYDFVMTYNVAGATASNREPDNVISMSASRRYTGVRVAPGASQVKISGTMGGKSFAAQQYTGRIIIELSAGSKSDRKVIDVDQGSKAFELSVPVTAADAGKPVTFSISGGTIFPNGYFHLRVTGSGS